MHLLFLNLGELLIPLWRGTLKCDPADNQLTWDWATLTGDVWQTHGQLVANATPFFPSSFHRPPRNPAEKISSGYKATEYYLYLFGLGPGLFRTVLPRKYWKNFCKLVRGARILTQRRITGAQLQEAHSHLIQFVEEYENIYYQRRVDRLHFCRPCIHTLLHTCDEVTRVGPGAYYTQFMMERTIGDLGKEIRQPSNPFANLAQRALRRSQVNALKNIYPELDPAAMPLLPRFSHDLGEGRVLLRPRDRFATSISGPGGNVLFQLFNTSKIRRWGRLRLPNGQVARSLWCESKRACSKVRVTRNVKIELNGQIEYAEVQFYFLHFTTDNPDDVPLPYALVSVYSRPVREILLESSYTLWVCRYRGDSDLRVIDLSSIMSCISMQPLPPAPTDSESGLWFVVEKSGLEDAELTGFEETLDGEQGHSGGASTALD
ncbi:hypothetical protein EDB86DRAFT_2808718 [Lactarius hatsudake]|nr:hypothetical protein EDB86DRAFT_2808718 [Lactarius hatsudake]